MNLDDYVKSTERELARHFNPNGIYAGRDGALRLAREFGYGLREYPRDEVRKLVGTLYGRFVVKNTLGRRGGVPVNAGEWIDEVLQEAGHD